MVDEELAAIAARWDRASNGPWEYVTDGHNRHAIDDDHGVIADLGGRVRADTGRVGDASAIAAAPADIAALLAEVARLQAALGEQHEANARLTIDNTRLAEAHSGAAHYAWVQRAEAAETAVARLRAAVTARDTLLRELRGVLAAAIFGLPPEEAGRLRGVIWEVLHGDDTA